MLVMDGTEATMVTRELEKIHGPTIKIPIIALSAAAAAAAAAMIEEKGKSIISGCDNYLTMPVNQDELFKTISQYLV